MKNPQKTYLFDSTALISRWSRTTDKTFFFNSERRPRRLASYELRDGGVTFGIFLARERFVNKTAENGNARFVHAAFTTARDQSRRTIHESGSVNKNKTKNQDAVET